MTADPIYQATKAALLIDPEQIASRPRWTLDAAKARIQNRKPQKHT